MMELKGVTAVKLNWDNLNKPAKKCPVEGWYVIDINVPESDYAAKRLVGYVLNVDYKKGKVIEISLTRQAIIDMLTDIFANENVSFPALPDTDPKDLDYHGI